MGSSAQTFWLQNLRQADLFNEWAFSQMRSHLGGCALEVGCGTGNFTVLLAQRCARVVAMDIDEEYVRIARERFQGSGCVEALQGDVTARSWEPLFDTVVMLDVLEHLPDDVGALRSLATALRPGGRIVLKVPAHQWLYSSLDEALGHYRRYDAPSLHRVLARAGLSCSALWHFNLLGVAGWWVNGRLLRRSVPPSAQVGLFNRLVQLVAPVEDRLHLPAGLSLFAVARAACAASA